jgi:hypothetical protein
MTTWDGTANNGSTAARRSSRKLPPPARSSRRAASYGLEPISQSRKRWHGGSNGATQLQVKEAKFAKLGTKHLKNAQPVL